MLFDSIHWYNVKRNLPILMRIVNAKIREVPLINSYELLLYLQIRTAQFKCKAYNYKDGKVDKSKMAKVNATHETIKVKYLVNGENMRNLEVETCDPAFNIINYSLQQNGIVVPGNTHGLRHIDSAILENALSHLDFKAVINKDDNGQLILEARPTDHTKVKYSN